MIMVNKDYHTTLQCVISGGSRNQLKGTYSTEYQLPQLPQLLQLARQGGLK